jgi:hypothetical protein
LDDFFCSNKRAFFSLYHAGDYRIMKTPTHPVHFIPQHHPESSDPGFKGSRLRHEPLHRPYKQGVGFVRIYPTVFSHTLSALL